MIFFKWNITKRLTEEQIRNLVEAAMPRYDSVVDKTEFDAKGHIQNIERIQVEEASRLTTSIEAINTIDKHLVDLERAVKIILQAEGSRDKKYARQLTKI
jgi:hypothetical protein